MKALGYDNHYSRHRNMSSKASRNGISLVIKDLVNTLQIYKAFATLLVKGTANSLWLNSYSIK